MTLLVNSLNRATSGQLVVDSISNIGPHYARTLREWRYRFVNNFAEIEKALRKDHPGVFDSKENEQSAYELGVFRRKWLCKKNPMPLYGYSRTDRLIYSHLNRLFVRLSSSIWENVWADINVLSPP